MLTIRKVIYNPPATIVLWNDGTKTTAKCDEADKYNKETGLMLCILKKKYGNKWVKAVLDKYVYNAEPIVTPRGAEVHSHGFRKPNVVKKRIKTNKPTRWLEFKSTTPELTIDIDDEEFVKDIIKLFFS